MDEGFYELKFHTLNEDGKIITVDYSSQRDPGYSDTAVMVRTFISVNISINFTIDFIIIIIIDLLVG